MKTVELMLAEIANLPCKPHIRLSNDYAYSTKRLQWYLHIEATDNETGVSINFSKFGEYDDPLYNLVKEGYDRLLNTMKLGAPKAMYDNALTYNPSKDDVEHVAMVNLNEADV